MRTTTKLFYAAISNQEVSFTFVIHNLEATDCPYVYVNTNGNRHIVDSGDVLVKNNRYSIKNKNFNLTNVLGSQEIVIELTNKQQSIDFWMKEMTR